MGRVGRGGGEELCKEGFNIEGNMFISHVGRREEL